MTDLQNMLAALGHAGISYSQTSGDDNFTTILINTPFVNNVSMVLRTVLKFDSTGALFSVGTYETGQEVRI